MKVKKSTRLIFPLFFVLGLISPLCTAGKIFGRTGKVIERVKIIRAVDGDTSVLASGERVRYLGIDSPEREEPLYSEATRANRRLVEGKTTRLELGEREKDPYGRLLAYIWIDGLLVNAELVRQGYASIRGEISSKYRKKFIAYQKEAFENRRGLWLHRARETKVKVFLVNADAKGHDQDNLNDEYITLKNFDTFSLELTGWTVADEANHRFTFPKFVLAPGATVTLHTGSGQDIRDQLYWGSESPIWNNSGDTIFLYNSEGRLTLMHVY